MSAFLEFLGMETGEKARAFFRWASPYLVLCLILLGSLSYVVHRFITPLPLLGHVAAIGAGLAVFVIFIAWGHRMVGEAMEGHDEDPPKPEA